MITNRKNTDILVALIPAVASSVLLFGIRSALIYLSCLASAFAASIIVSALTRKKTDTAFTVLVGILTAMSLPSRLSPVYAAVFSLVSAVIAVFSQKYGIRFGAILLTRTVLGFIIPGTNIGNLPAASDAVSTATQYSGTYPDIVAGLVGYQTGMIGETCAVALLVGGAYLLLRGSAEPCVLLPFFTAGAAVSLFFGLTGFDSVLCGSFIFITIFLLNDIDVSTLGRDNTVIAAAVFGAVSVILKIYTGFDATAIVAIIFELAVISNRLKSE